MSHQIPLSSHAQAAELFRFGIHQVRNDVMYKRLALVNCVYIRCFPDPQVHDWVLVDAGIPRFAHAIRRSAEKLFGGAPPLAIVLTHAHFDHVGSLSALLETWDVPVYAHPRELPYLNGTASYPPPDPSVGGGLVATSSSIFPRGPIDISKNLRVLPRDGSLPELPGWEWIATPGHSPGHVSLWRGSDGTLVAGDAFVTTAQESVYSVITQQLELHGPPAYFTINWDEAHQSVRDLAALRPNLAITGHGRAISGEDLRSGLRTLASRFRELAVPPSGRYVESPAYAADGTAYVDTHHR